VRHFVNIALLFFFVTLLISGLLRYLAPFSLVTTRVHVVFGLGVAVLVALHLIERTKYFKQILGGAKRRGDGNNTKRPSRRVPVKMLSGVVGLWALLLVAALWDYPPASSIIALSYEARQRSAIFRPDPKSVYKPIDEGMRLKRATASEASLLMEIEWGKAMDATFARAKGPGAGARPQIAIWAESKNGSLIETLFVSEHAAFREQLQWAGQPMRRGDVLPVWRHRYTLKTGVKPDGERAAYSGATPEHSFSLHQNLKIDGKPFYLYLEVNAPNDANRFFNSRHAPDHAGHTKPGIGQPSVIYGAYIEPDKPKQYLLLDLVGHGGSTNRMDGNIHYDLSNLTSAKRVIEKILVKVKRSQAATQSATQNTVADEPAS
jgi:hypothetical protein